MGPRFGRGLFAGELFTRIGEGSFSRLIFFISLFFCFGNLFRNCTVHPIHCRVALFIILQIPHIP